MVMMPILLLSGILLPMTLGEQWLQTVSDIIPVKHIVTAVRESFAGDVMTTNVLVGGLWALGLCAAAVWWGTTVFRRENA
jgi:ABC-2 type transport system permease protein